MPIRIRWKSKEYFGIGLLLLGMCGMFQLFFIFVGQYFLGIGNYIVVILLPIGIWGALFFASTIIFESYAQVERREKLRSQFKKSGSKISTAEKFLKFPITKPLIIIFGLFIVFFFSSYFISYLFVNVTLSFLIAENISAIICLLVANLIEKNYGRIRRF